MEKFLDHTSMEGSSPIIQIRGQNTVLGDKSPLIILDGVIISGRTEFSNNTSMQSSYNDS